MLELIDKDDIHEKLCLLVDSEVRSLSSNKKLLRTGLSLSTTWISLQLAGVKRGRPSDILLKPLIFLGVNQKSSLS